MILHTLSHLDNSVLDIVVSSLAEDDLVVLLTEAPSELLSRHIDIRQLAAINAEKKPSKSTHEINMMEFIELTNKAQQVVNW
jgi:sulfur transfer complex TusBCD TusB component (DsrH family)